MDDLPKSTDLHYEETPVIEEKVGQADASNPVRDFVAEESPPIGTEHELAAPPQKSSNVPGIFGNIVLFAVLFALGVGASVFLRQYLAQPEDEGSVTTKPEITATPTPIPTVSTDPFFDWKTYQPISGTTKQPVPGVTLKLPPDILTPICDGPSCTSQGTYLPGGTRFTVALRGKGQSLPTTAGAIMTDAGGREFIMKETSVSGLSSQEFTGLFAGTTGGGYTFAQIRGVVLHGPEGVSLEINHFTPTGVNANWDTDEALFDKIVGTVSFGTIAQPTLMTTPVITPLTIPTATSTALPTATTVASPSAKY